MVEGFMMWQAGLGDREVIDEGRLPFKFIFGLQINLHATLENEAAERKDHI